MLRFGTNADLLECRTIYRQNIHFIKFVQLQSKSISVELCIEILSQRICSFRIKNHLSNQLILDHHKSLEKLKFILMIIQKESSMSILLEPLNIWLLNVLITNQLDFIVIFGLQDVFCINYTVEFCHFEENLNI